MSLLNIHLGNPGIMLDHFQRAMPKQGLQGEHIAARTQIGDRKGVSETMGMTIFHAGFYA